MIKLLAKIITAVVLVLLLIYLLLPQPKYPLPLPNSVKSTEEGDTVQVPGVSAYYSQHNRAFVTKYYQEHFAQVPDFPLKFPSYRLSHPPQFAHEKIRDELLSSYFEEVVHPLRESLFVNGWEPAVFYKDQPGNIERYSLVATGVRYFSKATLRPFYSSVYARLVNYIGILVSGFILYYLSKRIIFSNS